MPAAAAGLLTMHISELAPRQAMTLSARGTVVRSLPCTGGPHRALLVFNQGLFTLPHYKRAREKFALRVINYMPH